MKQTTFELYSEKEHAEALRWWHSTGKKNALCDDCGGEMVSGEGYFVNGTVFDIGGTVIVDESGSLLCENCYKWRCEKEDEQLNKNA
jgi:hypothetical protein